MKEQSTHLLAGTHRTWCGRGLKVTWRFPVTTDPREVDCKVCIKSHRYWHPTLAVGA